MRKLLTLIIASSLFVFAACPKKEKVEPPAKAEVAKPEVKVEKALPEPKTAEEKQAAGEFTKENVAAKAKAFEAELDKDTEGARTLGAEAAKE